MNKQRLFFRTWLPMLVMACYLMACGDGNDPKPTEPDQYLVQAETIKTLTKEEVAKAVGSNPLYQAMVRYGVTTYRITYKTKDTDGKEIQASGALVIPTLAQGASGVPMISYQHGTLSSESQAPSNFGSGTDSQLTTLMASLGYVAVAPDYIGYGVSKDLAHTYEHRQGLSQASLDFLRAAKEYFAKNNTTAWDKRLYLTGYSEGGYATMSLLKKMEEEASGEFNLRAVSAGSGAYNKTAFMKSIINETTTTKTAGYNRLYAWVLLTYNRIYGLNRPASYYFKEPYASQIPAAVKHVSDLGQLTINTNITNTFTDAFKKAVNDGTETGFLNAVKDNDVYDWKPKTPLWLYHGTADDLVPFFNSQSAAEAMAARGATTVRLFPIPNANHEGGVVGYASGTISLLSTFP